MPQSLANILVHVIFSTKERRPLINDSVRPGLHAYMAGILQELDLPALVINSVADHAHILCSLSKKSRGLQTCGRSEEKLDQMDQAKGRAVVWLAKRLWDFFGKPIERPRGQEIH